MRSRPILIALSPSLSHGYINNFNSSTIDSLTRERSIGVVEEREDKVEVEETDALFREKKQAN